MKVAVLIRESKTDGGSTGIVDTQRDQLTDWCRRQRHEIVDYYVDDGVSGVLAFRERDHGARLLRDAHRGRFEAVVLTRVDRAGRSVDVIYDFLRELEAIGIPCIFATQPVDTRTPGGRAHLEMLALFAQMERDLAIERMYEGRRHTARNGGHAGGQPPFGYRVEDGGDFPVLVVDREPARGCSFSEAELVERIFRDFVDEHSSVQQVADALNHERVPTPSQLNYPRHRSARSRGDGWSVATVYRILTNPLYKGLQQWGKGRGQRKAGEPTYEREAPHLAIVPPELWERAQRLLHENAKRSAQNAKSVYLLGGGLMRCASCGYAYSGCDHGPTNGGRVYACAGRSQFRARRCQRCTAPILKADEYERAVWDCIVRFAQNPQEALDRLERELNARPAERDQAQADMLVSALAALGESRRRAERLFVRGTWTEERLDAEVKDLDREEAELREQLGELRARLTEADHARQHLTAAERLPSELRGRIDAPFTAEEQRRIVRDAVVQILVEPGLNGWRVRVQFVFGESVVGSKPS
jgi:site-specific DNA recombinase